MALTVVLPLRSLLYRLPQRGGGARQGDLPLWYWRTPETNFEAAVPNEILAITASRREHQTYVDFIIDNPLAAKTYKVLFGDIYTLTPRILPELDLVTLFHLCEFYDERTTRYAELDDYSLVTLFVSKLNAGGKVLFYKGSSHFSRCREVVDTIATEGRLVPVDDYKSLLVYGLP